MLMQNFGVTNKEHYDMLWYFLEWSIGSLLSNDGGDGNENGNTGKTTFLHGHHAFLYFSLLSLHNYGVKFF